MKFIIVASITFIFPYQVPFREGLRSGIRPAGFKDAAKFDGKNGALKPKQIEGVKMNSDVFRAGDYLDGMRNKRDVWHYPTAQFPDAHFAVFPTQLIVDPIKAGSRKEGIVLDPFCGSNTTGYVAEMLGRKWIGIELNPEYITLAEKRLYREPGLFAAQ